MKEFKFMDILASYRKLFVDWLPANTPEYWEAICEYSLENLEKMMLTWEEATPYLYVKDKILGGNADRSIRHLFIDEAQDYTAFQLAYMKQVFPYTRMTFLGDINQAIYARSEEHTSELQSRGNLVCRLLLEKKNKQLLRIT